MYEKINKLENLVICWLPVDFFYPFENPKYEMNSIRMGWLAGHPLTVEKIQIKTSSLNKSLYKVACNDIDWFIPKWYFQQKQTETNLLLSLKSIYSKNNIGCDFKLDSIALAFENRMIYKFTIKKPKN